MCDTPNPVKTKEELAKEGWKQASVTGGQHLQRTLQMYEELGFEVHLEEVDPNSCGHCTACFTSGSEKMYRVYTRPGA